jgi:hypothetical protein
VCDGETRRPLAEVAFRQIPELGKELPHPDSGRAYQDTGKHKCKAFNLSEDRAGNGCGSLGSLPGTVGIPERLVPVPDATCGRRRISRIYTDPKLRFLRFFPHFIHPAQFSAFWNLHCGGVRGTVCFGSGKPRARAGGSRDAAEQTGCHAAHVGTRRTVLQKTSNGMTRRFLSHP